MAERERVTKDQKPVAASDANASLDALLLEGEGIPMPPDWNARTELMSVTQEAIRRVQPGADLQNRNLTGLDLSGLNLCGVDLSGSDLTECKIVGTQFDGATLKQVNFEAAQITDSTFVGAELIDSQFQDTVVDRCNFENANLSGAVIQFSRLADSSLKGAQLVGAHIDNTDVRGNDLTNARLISMWLTRSQFFQNNCDFATIEASHLRFLVSPPRALSLALANAESVEEARKVDDEVAIYEAQSSGNTFRQASFKDTEIREVMIKQVDFSNTTLTGVTFVRAVSLDESMWDGARLKDVMFEDVTLIDAKMNAELSNVRFSVGSVVGADMSKAKFQDVRWDGTAFAEQTTERGRATQFPEGYGIPRGCIDHETAIPRSAGLDQLAAEATGKAAGSGLDWHAAEDMQPLADAFNLRREKLLSGQPVNTLDEAFIVLGIDVHGEHELGLRENKGFTLSQSTASLQTVLDESGITALHRMNYEPLFRAHMPGAALRSTKENERFADTAVGIMQLLEDEFFDAKDGRELITDLVDRLQHDFELPVWRSLIVKLNSVKIDDPNAKQMLGDAVTEAIRANAIFEAMTGMSIERKNFVEEQGERLIEAKRLHRKAARQFHPDHNHDEGASDAFKTITSADEFFSSLFGEAYSLRAGKRPPGQSQADLLPDTVKIPEPKEKPMLMSGD